MIRLLLNTKQLNWNIKDIVDDKNIKARDPWQTFKLSYVQFSRPDDPDTCLAINEDGRFTDKSCQEDLKSGKLETVFSIIPTTT